MPVGATEELVVEMLLGDIARLRGDLAAAEDHARESADLQTTGHRTWTHNRALLQYVDVLIKAGKAAAAVTVALPELQLLYDRGYLSGAALLAERLAIVLVGVGRGASAAHFAQRQLAITGRRQMSFDRLVRETLMNELQGAPSADAASTSETALAATEPAAVIATLVSELRAIGTPIPR